MEVKEIGRSEVPRKGRGAGKRSILHPYIERLLAGKTLRFNFKDSPEGERNCKRIYIAFFNLKRHHPTIKARKHGLSIFAYKEDADAD